MLCRGVQRCALPRQREEMNILNIAFLRVGIEPETRTEIEPETCAPAPRLTPMLFVKHL